MASLNQDPIPAPSRPCARRVAEAVFVAVVLGWLGSFPVRTLMESRPVETVTLDGEKRAPTPFPNLATLPSRDWGRGIEAWYNDSMPSRPWLIRRARKWHLGQLLSPFGVYVPGCGGQRFRIGKEWPELEDYLGTFHLDGVALGRWADLFTGRRAWAEAMGCSFVSVVSPEKVQLMPEAPFPWLSRHRGECLYDQLAAHLFGLGESANILSPRGVLRAPGDRRPLFLDATDHHPDAEGLYRMCAAIADAIPGCGVIPWCGAAPPPDVAVGQVPECWTDGRRLRVSAPGWETYFPDDLALAPLANPEPNQRSVGARRAGGGTGLHLVLAHTSYLRYTLASWDDAGLPVRFPFGDGTAQVDSLLWKFLDDDDLDRLTSAAVPAAIVQEINEWHLSLHPRDSPPPSEMPPHIPVRCPFPMARIRCPGPKSASAPS